MKSSSLFNGPVEVGLRSAMLLAEAYPMRLDLNRLVILDYMMLYSGDIPDGPESLHPPSPLRAGEVTVRRGLVEKGLHLFATKGLVSRHADESGITYSAQDIVPTFLDALCSDYAGALRERASWAVQRLSGLTDAQANELFEETIGRWKTEFVVQELEEDEA